MLINDSARTASRNEFLDRPSSSARSASRGSRSPALSCPPTIISLMRRIASSVSATALSLVTQTVDGNRVVPHDPPTLGRVQLGEGEGHVVGPRPVGRRGGQDRPVAAEEAPLRA